VAEKTATVAGENLEGSEARGCLQGCIILPLLWSLVVDELVGGAIMHWGRQMTLLSLSVENYQHHLRASTGRLSIQFISGVIGLSCLLIYRC